MTIFVLCYGDKEKDELSLPIEYFHSELTAAERCQQFNAAESVGEKNWHIYEIPYMPQDWTKDLKTARNVVKYADEITDFERREDDKNAERVAAVHSQFQAIKDQMATLRDLIAKKLGSD